ncbi:acyl carrier protein [Acidithiobacillus sp. MC6.1]|nr:acyl carrier protein [Acidithiobacillus sp. MC6.1]
MVQSAISAECKLQEDLGLDSLSVMELTMALEDHFDIDILDEEVHSEISVAGMAKLVEGRFKIGKGDEE